MTPAAILAAARSKPLSPIVPARGEWLKDWRGPVLLAGQRATVFWTSPDGGRAGVITDELREDATYAAELLCVDLRRREVRHRLVDLGAPEWCRESVAGMLGWVLTGSKADGLAEWCQPSWRLDGLVWMRLRIGAAPDVNAGAVVSGVTGDCGWLLQPRDRLFSLRRYPRGPETGPEGRARADLAALSAGCVLTEADGWFIPLPGGDVGWLPKEAP